MAYVNDIPYTGNDPITEATSKAAAIRMAGKVGSLRYAVLKQIANSVCGLTDLDLQLLIPLKGSTERPRRIELKRAGLIKADGKVVVGSGLEATVWVATTQGRQVIAEAEVTTSPDATGDSRPHTEDKAKAQA